MLCTSVGTQDDLPWQTISFDDMKACFEDFVEANSFPLKHDGTSGSKRMAVKAHADDLVACFNLILASNNCDHFRGDQVACVASSIEDRFEVVGVNRRRKLPNLNSPNKHLAVFLNEVSLILCDKSENRPLLRWCYRAVESEQSFLESSV